MNTNGRKSNFLSLSFPSLSLRNPEPAAEVGHHVGMMTLMIAMPPMIIVFAMGFVIIVGVTVLISMARVLIFMILLIGFQTHILLLS